MSKIADEHRLLLKNRVRRLARLVDLDAPDVILMREARLVEKAARRIDPALYYATVADDELEAAKRSMRLCLTDGCEELVADPSGVHADPNSRPFADEHCEKHEAEMEAQAAEDDEAIGDDDLDEQDEPNTNHPHDPAEVRLADDLADGGES